KQSQPRQKNLANFVRVVFNVKDSGSRAAWSANLLILRLEEGKRNRSPCGDRGGSDQEVAPIDAHAVTPKAARARCRSSARQAIARVLVSSSTSASGKCESAWTSASTGR